MALLAAYSTPWKGINTSVPDNHIDRGETTFSSNFTYYEGLLSQPAYAYFGPNSSPPDGNPVEAVYSFVASDNSIHQGVITKAHLYDGVTSSSWGTGHALPATGVTLTNYQIFTNSLFIVNGTHYIIQWDGTSLTSATVDYGGRYIFELASSLCIANTNETVGGIFRQRVRWSVAGVPTDWTSIGSGFEDLLECPDGITGVLNTSPVAYIIRDNGVTQMIPTGVGTSAFSFNHLWASEHGIGNVLVNTAANFGPVGFLVASDNVYVLTSSSYEKIGSKILNTLYPDLNNSSFHAAWVEPLITKGLPYLRYRLALRVGSGSNLTIWSFNTENYSWELESYDGIYPTGRAGYLATTASTPIITNFPALPVFDGTIYRLLSQGLPAQNTIMGTAFCNFKKEYDPKDYASITVRRVLVRYQYLGSVSSNAIPVTVQLKGMFGNSVALTLNLGDPSQTKQYYGGYPAPSVNGQFYMASFSVGITDPEFQVSLTVAPPLASGVNSIRISDIMVFGDVGKETTL